MRTEEVFKLIPDRLNGFVRLPTLTETFRALRYGRPLDNNERVVCLDYHSKIGEDVLIVTAYGPVVMPCLSIWSEDYTFPVITNGA
jgi:hypothetical protein